ncbi:ABC-F family ATP-binding cassette domain-containing protein [Tessaracoccus caeni]|uniref:ABC-F family ATP-binding cassette domain-containing protein n=1 Tax=Tessaracoccus caeni TaxID=3031239 RepID=UPI0023DB409F|nr:ATP-binding cassette domain-containing protein [Tessaracoccus caeni]MDF1487527.1 ATP-binding cassette domain-containing protein [Tessaracoccus caeni]
MGFLEAFGVRYALPDGRALLRDVHLKVGDGNVAAIVGANGCGKTTLMRILAGELPADKGSVRSVGGVAYMPQFVGARDFTGTITDLLLTMAPPSVQRAARRLRRAEDDLAARDRHDEQMAYANALIEWADVGGYAVEHSWEIAASDVLGASMSEVGHRASAQFSGGEQKQLVIRALLEGDDEVLLLDEPDNYLDVPAKMWFEDQLRATSKSVLLITHDRELLAAVGDHIITLEGREGRGNSAWAHGGGYASYREEHLHRHARLDLSHRRWREQRDKLTALVERLRNAASPKTGAAVTRLERHLAKEPPRAPEREEVQMRFAGGQTAKRVLTASGLAVEGLTDPFDLEVLHGERVAVLGGNGVGKSHLLRVIAGDETVAYRGSVTLGARVQAGHFSQTNARADLDQRQLSEILWDLASLQPDEALEPLARYGLDKAIDQRFHTLSGGQQARLQILLLELSGATLLLLDEPTDNLDVPSAEALEAALEDFDGTVITVTHDRWFANGFDRFLVLERDGSVREVEKPDWQKL